MFLQTNIVTFYPGSPSVPLTSADVAFNLPTTAGSALVVDMVWEGTSGAHPAAPVVTDTQGNTYTLVYSTNDLTGAFIGTYVALATVGGANVVNVSQSASDHDPAYATVAVSEYSNVSGVDVHAIVSSTTGPPTVSVTTTHAADLLHLVGGSFSVFGGLTELPITGPAGWYPRSSGIGLATFDLNKIATGTYSASVQNGQYAVDTLYAAIVAFELTTPESPIPEPGDAWLIIDDGPGYTDRSSYISLSSGQELTFSGEMGQRWTATVPLRIHAADDYLSTATELDDIVGVQAYIYDQTDAGAVTQFCGTIDKVEVTWDGFTAERLVTLTLVSFEQCFDTIYPTPDLYGDVPSGLPGYTSDQIVQILLAKYAAGAPVYLGTIATGPTIPEFLVDGETRLSDLLSTLATASDFVWGVDPASQAFYFCPPSDIGAPFDLNEDSPALFATYHYILNRQDFRDAQLLKVDDSAFGYSASLFPGQGSAFGNQDYYVDAPVGGNVVAWVTKSTQNTAVGNYSGQPNPGDTISIGINLPYWQASGLYGLGNTIVDSNGHQQVVLSSTPPSYSGSSQPTWNSAGGLTTDNDIVWQDLGPTTSTYCFVTALDNRTFGQVLIGPSALFTYYNLADAVNCNLATRGFKFSMATWEHPVCNIDLPQASTFTIRSKAAGSAFTSALSANAANFSWSAGSTSGGTDGPTSSLSVGLASTANGGQILYTPGSTRIQTAPNYGVPSGSYLQVQYTRVAGNIIVCEDSDLVAERAAIEQGTGKYQQLFTDPNTTSAVAALQECQGALAAYSVIPRELDVDIFQAGLLPGQSITLSVQDSPNGIAALVNGSWIVFDVSAKLIPAQPRMPIPGAGHFRYTVKLINQSQIGSYLSFWEGLKGGAGGGGGIAGAISNSGTAPGPAVGGGPLTTLTASGSTFTPNFGLGTTNFRILLGSGGPYTITAPIGVAAAASVNWSLVIEQDATGGRLAVTDGSFYFAGDIIGQALPSTRSVIRWLTDQNGNTTFDGLPVLNQPIP